MRGTYNVVVSTRLETARLVIRTFEARDVGPWLAMVTDPEVRRFLPPDQPRRWKLAQRVIGQRQAMERELGHAMWAVEGRPRARSSGNAACGQSMREQGQKSTSRITSSGPAGARDMALRRRSPCSATALGGGLDCIMAVVVPENVGSWRVMEKAGMRYAGLVDYYGMEGLKKYVAAREWWRSPARLMRPPARPRKSADRMLSPDED